MVLYNLQNSVIHHLDVLPHVLAIRDILLLTVIASAQLVVEMELLREPKPAIMLMVLDVQQIVK